MLRDGAIIFSNLIGKLDVSLCLPFKRCVMSRLTAAIAMCAAIGVFQAHASDIEFGETKTQFEILRSLDAKVLLRPWDLNWRNTVAWQAGNSKPRESFAPPGCYVTRLVTTCQKTNWQREYICR
jgi:hypothetical protein